VPTPTVAPPACGVERWDVKTLSDPDVFRVDLDNVQSTTIRDLNLLPVHCSSLPPPRTFPAEFQAFEVTGRIIVARLEDDRDYHVALADPTDGSFTIVTEIPDPQCSGAATSPYRQTLAQVRTAFESLIGGRSVASVVGTTVRVRGVGFYDFNHGQSGRSESCVELHALISLQVVR
jgi:hypothetical protein